MSPTPSDRNPAGHQPGLNGASTEHAPALGTISSPADALQGLTPIDEKALAAINELPPEARLAVMAAFAQVFERVGSIERSMERLVRRLPMPTFNDVTIEPAGRSEVTSREMPDLSVQLSPRLRLEVPFLYSPMDTVHGPLLAREMIRLGSVAMCDRFCTQEERLARVREYGDRGVHAIGIDENFDFIKQLADAGAVAVCIDVNNGHMDGPDKSVARMINRIRREIPGIDVIAGNIGSVGGMKMYIDAGVHCVKAGIGPGSPCTTRLKTGIGVPQMGLIDELSALTRQYKIPFIADGGIEVYDQEHSEIVAWDVCKAITGGATAIMMGKGFARCVESGAPKFQDPETGILFGKYRGLSSTETQDHHRGGLKAGRVPEGRSGYVQILYTAERVVTELAAGLRQSMTQQNARTIGDLVEHGHERIRRVSTSYVLESGTRIHEAPDVSKLAPLAADDALSAFKELLERARR